LRDKRKEFFDMNDQKRRPSRLWSAAAQTKDGEYGVYLAAGLDYIGFIAEADVPRAVADMKAYFGDDDFLAALVERAARDMPLLRSPRIKEIVARTSAAKWN
jgi:hypothetical protein